MEKKQVEDFDYCYLGPFLVQDALKTIHIPTLDYKIINPISWRWTSKLIAFKSPDYIFLLKNRIRRALKKNAEGYFIHPTSKAVHLFNDSWKNYSLKKDDRFHKRSIFEQLKARYL